MSRKSHNDGQRGGAGNDASTRPTKSFFGVMAEGYSNKEIKDIKDWDKGYKKGRNDRK